MVEDRKMKLETQQLSSQRLLNDEKLVVKEQELKIAALREKVERLHNWVSDRGKTCADYDALTAQAIKSNMAINMCKEKAMVR